MVKRVGTTLLLWACWCLPTQADTATDAVVTGAYDGDTLYVEAQIWPSLTWAGSVRVLGVDTPEIRGQCETEKTLAKAARDYVRDLLTDTTVRLTEVESDKYGGRVLARVHFREGDAWVDLADRLVEVGVGRAYEGGARKEWCGE